MLQYSPLCGLAGPAPKPAFLVTRKPSNLVACRVLTLTEYAIVLRLSAGGGDDSEPLPVGGEAGVLLRG
jgi:hypothetical protein